MADETNRAVSYLRALKQASEFHGGAAAIAAAGNLAAQQNAGAPAPHPQARRSEKRRTPRYKCEGKAEVRPAGGGMRAWAAFTDISLLGCYLEATTTFPVRTNLHLKLQACGIQFEGKGEVQVTYPGLGMGVAFTDMTESNRANLQQMLALVVRTGTILGSRPASDPSTMGPLGDARSIKDPARALQALFDHFETRRTLAREDFVKVIKTSQSPGSQR
jgi:hypothetical protein